MTVRATQFANCIIKGTIFFSVVTLIYFAYYYGWNHERYFTSPVGPVFYYILPAALAGLLLVSLRWTPSYRINLAFLLLSIGGSCYAAELLLTFSNFVFSQHAADKARAAERAKIVKIAKEFGVDFDTRSKLEVIRDLEKQHINAVPIIFPRALLKKQKDGTLRSEITINGTETLPLGGIASRTTAFCNEGGYWVIYESDEHGFHNPKGIWGAGRVDIAAVGDSWVNGFCVPSDKNFVALIRKHYPATLSLGGNGNGPLAELATLKEYLPSLKPKIVLWFYAEENDFPDLEREKSSPLLMSYLRGDFAQGLLNRQASIDRALMAYMETARKNVGMMNRLTGEGTNGDANRMLADLKEAIKLAHLRLRLGLAHGGSYRKNQEAELDLNLFSRILSQTKALVSTWGGTLDFVYLPAWARYISSEIIHGSAYNDIEQARFLASERAHDRVLELVRAIGLPVIDGSSIFQAHGEPLALFTFRQRAHYTEEGNRLVAEEVLHSISLGN
jgi:hypothetical protein